MAPPRINKAKENDFVATSAATLQDQSKSKAKTKSKKPSNKTTKYNKPRTIPTIDSQSCTCIGRYLLTNVILGTGSFGVVRLAYKLSATKRNKKKVAIKIVSKDDPKRLETLQKEIILLKEVANNHANLIHLYEVLEDQTYMYLVFQHKSCDLYTFLEKRGRLSEDVAMKIFSQLVDGVAYLHSVGVAHRDIKLENILIDDVSLEVSLADFGFATRYAPNEKLDKWCGSPYTVSPEIIMHIPYNAEKVDVWALGSVLYTMLCGMFPFQADTINDVLRKTKAFKMNPFHTEVGYSSRDLILSMLTVSTSKRMNLTQVKQHSWMLFATVAKNRLSRSRQKTTIQAPSVSVSPVVSVPITAVAN